MNIYLCGIVQNEEQNINELTQDIYEYFDGLIWVDGGSTDNTVSILENRKKQGKILYRKWTNDHDFQSNEILRCGVLKNGDWFVLRDATERLSLDFCQSLKQVYTVLKDNNVKSIYSGGKLCMAEYQDDMFFLGTPHWGVHNVRQNILDLDNCNYDILKNGFYSIKTRTREEWILHDLKYYYVYDGRSNHIFLYYKEKEDIQKQEYIRRYFRHFCLEELCLDPTIESLKNYLINNKNRLPQEIRQCINESRILNRVYQLFCLNKTGDEIDKNIQEREMFISNVDMVNI